MSRVVSASDYSRLRPQSHGIVFNQRQPFTPSSRSSTRSSEKSSGTSVSTASVSSVPDPTLSQVDIEQILLQKMIAKEEELKKAFRTIDIDQTLKVTKGEFRRVIETFLLPLTQDQFDSVLAKIPGSTKVTVPYLEFLSRFAKPVDDLSVKWNDIRDNQTRTLTQLECLLREKISKKMKRFIKTCRLFDYNQNGQIQRHELRRILEVNCFRMTDCEYDKLWNRYCICRTNTLNYKEFLQYLGIHLEKRKKRMTESQDSVQDQNEPAEKKSETKLLSPTIAGYNLTKIHLDTTAKNFREKLRSAYENIVKAFRAFDVGRSGFVSLEYLKSVLNTFVFPIRSDVFQELMNIFGIKLSKNMAWERFLDKFQDPLIFDMSRTSPTRKHHRSRKLDEALSSDRILLKLHGHIQDAYSSLKKAFLMLDRNQDGKITRNELRRILDCIMFRISDDDFQELIKIIDPEHTGHLSYNKFLNLFEDKDSIPDAKCINGSKNAKKLTSVLEAWNIAEDVLTEQVKGYWNEFNKALQASDPQNNGIISRNNFRKVLQLYCPSLTDDHFIALYQKYQDDTTEGVLYRMLLHSLGVADLPKELTAFASTPSSQGNQQKEDKKLADLLERMKQIEDHAYKYTKNRTVDEVIERLREGILQQEASLRDAFLAYNKQASGTLSKTDFKKLLDNIGMPMSDDQFNLLIEKIGFPVGGLSYLDFVAVFEDSRLNGHSPNRQATAQKCHFLSAEECLSQYSDKLVEEYGDPYIAFRKIDQNNDGIITMLDFRRLLNSFMISMIDKEYVRLLGILGMNEASTLNYPEFLQLFQVHATKEMRPWLIPSYKPKQIAANADLACEQAHYYLTIKAQSRWNDLAMHFHEYDIDGNSIILKKDLKDVLYRCGIPLNPKEFEKLWARYDINAKGYLTHQEFLQKMGVENIPSDTGLNKRIMAEDYVRFMDHFKREDRKHIDINEIIIKIREKYHECSQDFHKAFLQQDKNKEGYISVVNLRKMLEDFHCCLGYEQNSELLYSLGISIQDNKISYFDFLRAIDDRGAFKRWRRSTVPPVPPISFVQLSIEEAMAKIKQIVTDSSNLLYKAFSAFDKERTGAISTLDFRQVLHHFCFTLSEKQFNHLLKLQRLRGEHSIDWKYFLQQFNFFSEAPAVSRPYTAAVPSPPILNCKPIESKIRKSVQHCWKEILKECRAKDVNRLGEVSVEDMFAIMEKFHLDLTKEEIKQLVTKYDFKSVGKFAYCDFLQSCVLRFKQQEVSPLQRVVIQNPRVQNPLGPQSPTFFNAMMRIQPQILHCWRPMRRTFKCYDESRTGLLSVQDFRQVLRKYGINLSEEEFFHILEYYDKTLTSRISYNEFLRAFLQ